MTRCRNRLVARVLFYMPPGAESGWQDSDLWRAAARIPGVTVLPDSDGVEASRFQAFTSGHVLLFDTRGHRLFSGGITGSRGHAGANGGEDAIVSLVNAGNAPRGTGPVFGCSLGGVRR